MTIQIFSQINGNELAKQYLSQMIDKQQIAQSLLFAGPENAHKEDFARAFAKRLLETTADQCPDLRIYKPEGKIGMHSIESMRQFIQEVYMPPYISKRKIFILSDAERMLSYSANALLKTFEEPAPHSIIILLTAFPEQLLSTILSRCFTIRFQPATKALRKISLHNALKTLLTYGQKKNYLQIMHAAKSISSELDAEEEKLRNELLQEGEKFFPEGLSAIQKHALEKEVEGILTVKYIEQARNIFESLLAWHRDMHLLHVNGNAAYLHFPEHQQTMIQQLQSESLPSLDKIQKAISQANLALVRSTSLLNCLENLFLQV